MKEISPFYFSLIILTLLTSSVGCSRSTTTQYPTPAGFRIINHDKPALSVNSDVFNDVGCSDQEPPPRYDNCLSVFEDLEARYDCEFEKIQEGRRQCSDESIFAQLGCDEIKVVSNLFGGLTPAYPIAYCMEYASDDPPGLSYPENQYFYDLLNPLNSPCLFNPLFVRYVIYANEQFTVITNEDEFRKIFAPIESPEEALSYALAMEGWSAYYGLSYNPNYSYSISLLEDTHVETTQNGYVVNLYHYRVCGCRLHWTTLYEIGVTHDGSVEVLKSTPAFRDPVEDNACW